MSELNTIETTIALLSRGLEIKNWSLVESALYFLVGSKASASQDESLDVSPIPPKKTKVDTSNKRIKSSANQDMDFSVERPSKKKARVKGVNKFEDMVKNVSIEEDPDIFNAINDNVKPTPRKRPKYKPAKILCSQCDSEDLVNPALVADKNSYVCSRCIEKRVKGRR